MALSKGPDRRVRKAAQQPPTPGSTPGPGLECGPPTSAEQGAKQGGVSETLAGLDANLRQQLFEHFQTDLQSASCPFVTLRLNDSNSKSAIDIDEAEALFPFTVAACLMVALRRRVPVQKAVATELLASMSTALILKGHKSFDLLQCIILITARYPYHMVHSPQLNNLIHLAQSLAIDLNLNEYNAFTGLPVRMSNEVALMFGTAQGPSSTLAENRATLCIYYLQAMYAISLRRMEYPRWSARLDHAIEYLRVHSEDITDIYAVNVLEALRTASQYLVPDGIRPSSSFSITAYTKSFCAELSLLRSRFPASLLTHPLFTQDLVTVEIALWDLGLAALETTLSAAASVAERVYTLSSVHNILMSFANNYLALPLDLYPLLNTLHMGAHLSQFMEVFMKLHFLADFPSALPGSIDISSPWNTSDPSPDETFPHIAERIAVRMEEVFLNERKNFPELECYMFAVYPIKMRQWKRKFEDAVAKRKREQEHEEERPSAARAATVETPVRPVNVQMPQQTLFNSPGFDDFMQWPFPLEEFGWP